MQEYNYLTTSVGFIVSRTLTFQMTLKLVRKRWHIKLYFCFNDHHVEEKPNISICTKWTYYFKGFGVSSKRYNRDTMWQTLFHSWHFWLWESETLRTSHDRLFLIKTNFIQGVLRDGHLFRKYHCIFGGLAKKHWQTSAET